MRRVALAAVLAAACSHPHPHPEGAPTPTGSATPIEPPLDAGAPAAPIDSAPAPEANATAPDATPPTAAANPCGDAVGTIGMGGSYGPIGHGSGTANGYGVGGGGCGGMQRTAAMPSIKLGAPKTKGGRLDNVIVRRYLKRNTNKFEYCYEKELLAKPDLKGVVTLTYKILPNGTVADASAKGVDDVVGVCDAEVAKDIEYPKPKGEDPVDVTVTITYAPTGG
jgi:hypothetical protein